MLKKCFGIVSYFPDENEYLVREKRTNRLTNLLLQLNTIWPSIDILIVAQNWQDYQLPEIKNKIRVFKYDEPLTIVGARNTLRDKFLELDYDYIIMLDDDAHIFIGSQEIADNYMNTIDANPDKFCFIHSENHWHTMDDYIQAPLNLCAISKFIYKKEPIPKVYLENSDALEDDIFAVLLHIKYAEYEFLPPKDIYCDHFDILQYSILANFSNRIWPSTWYKAQTSNFKNIDKNTREILDYIVDNKDLPDKIKA